MSLRVAAIVREVRLPKAMKRRPEAKHVLLSLAHRCDDEGRNAGPSIDTIAAESEIGEHTSRKCLERLRAAGLISEQEPPRQRRPRVWQLELAALAALLAPRHGEELNPPSGPHDRAELGPEQDGLAPHIEALAPHFSASGPQHRAGLAASAPHDRARDLSSSSRSCTTTPEAQEAVRAFLETFDEQYRAHRHVAYRVRAGDRERVAQLLAAHGVEPLRAMSDLLLRFDGDDWLGRSDRSISVLMHRASWLAARLRETAPSTPNAWDKIRSALQRRISREQFEQWLRPTRELSRLGDLLVVAVEGTSHATLIREDFTAALNVALTESGTGVRELVFRPVREGRVPGAAETYACNELRDRAWQTTRNAGA